MRASISLSRLESLSKGRSEGSRPSWSAGNPSSYSGSNYESVMTGYTRTLSICNLRYGADLEAIILIPETNQNAKDKGK